MERKQFSMTLGPELWAFVDDYREKMGHESISAAIKDLIMVSMTQGIDVAVAHMARKEALYETRKWAFGRIQRAFEQMEKEMGEL
jgi:hypothetical protein